MNQEEAEQALTAWASIERDDLVRAAHEAGVSKNRIHLITGIARTTIDRILETPMPQTQMDRLVAYLAKFIYQWPRRTSPFDFVLPATVSSVFSPQQIAEQLLADAEFKAIKLGTILNTPDGQLLAGAVGALTPPPYDEDIALLVEALQIAAKLQQDAARDVLLKGAVIALGVTVVAAALGNSGSA